MKITRRKFLKTSSSAAALGAGAVFLPRFATGQTVEKGSTIDTSGHLGGWDPFNAIANFNKADFEGQVGTEFTLLSQTYGHRSATLIGVREPTKRNGERTQGFSLVFKGQEWQEVNQDVYYVAHPKLGDFHALMSPVRESRKSSDLCYEAVINRLI